MFKQNFCSDDELPLVQSSHAMFSTPVLDKGIQLINNMIKLNYIRYDPSSGLNFTPSGIEYMINKYSKSDGLKRQFDKSNMCIDNDQNEPDYNDPSKACHIKEARHDKIVEY